jgi:hypothetical protein
MASYIKASLKRSFADSFLTELERNDNQYFFFVAKSTPWASENSPPEYTDTVASENEVMNNIIAYKKITPTDVYFAIPRYEWSSGVSYAEYDDAAELFQDSDPKNFYVVTDELNVYKCLGNSGGAVSVEKPTQTNPGNFTLSDGYVWQYLATVRESDLPYQLTSYYPIDYAYVSDDTEIQNQYNAQISAVPGAIDRLVLSGIGFAGASAGVYNQSLFGDSAIRLSSITQISSTRKEVVITDSASRTLIGSNAGNYINYILRISDSTVVPSEINNYGVIVGGNVEPNRVVFFVENDAIDFTFTPPESGNSQQVVRAEILPWINLVGDGYDGYVFPNMKTDKTIASVTVANGGKNYSKVEPILMSPKTATTVHPSMRVVLSPKQGHGSNILRELNIKDIIIVVKIDESDEAFRIGGSYRQFGIIKNPVLSDGTQRFAGAETEYFRDIILIPDTFYSDSDFQFRGTGVLLGEESYSSSRISSANNIVDSVVNFDGSRVRVKTINSTDKFITRLDRVDDYVLTLTDGSVPIDPFFVGETVTQSIPSGTVLPGGFAYSYDIEVTGSVISQEENTLTVKLQSGGNFSALAGVPISGYDSGLTANVADVTPRYGEYVRIADVSPEQSFFVSRTGNDYRLYKIDTVGAAYYDSRSTPSYRGLHQLDLVSSVSSAVGGPDITTSPVTPTAFSVGQVVSQGISSANYASGVVYSWEFVNSSYGKLYLTGVTGAFLSVQSNGLTGTTLSSYYVASYSPPEIQRNSGEILYISNVRPVTRGIGQKEEFRLRLGF